MRGWWRHISDPSLWPNERLFYELYGQAIQGRAHTVEMLDGIIDDWLEPAAEINMALGLSRAAAVAHARLGIAVTRGLLLDLVATRDVEGVDAAMEAFIEIYISWLRSASPGRGLRGARTARPACARTPSASKLGSLRERRISPLAGSSERSMWRSGFHSSERIIAFGHWVWASSIATRRPRLAACPRRRFGQQLGVIDDFGGAVDAKRVAHPGDEEQQGDARVRQHVGEGVGDPVAGTVGQQQGASSRIRTKPAGSPRGETSSPPSGIAVPTHTNGDRSMNCLVS